MISSKPPRATGQAAVESLIGMSLMTMLALSGTVILLLGFLTLAAVRWAALNSQCVATTQKPAACDLKTEKELGSYFALHHVRVKSKIIRGIIHTEVNGRTVGELAIHARYDLGPSEYKRDKQ